MTEARKIIKELKDKLEEMQELYDILPDKSTQAAKELEENIEKLAKIIKENEEFINNYDKAKFDSKAEQEQANHIMNGVLNNLRGYHEGYINSNDMIKNFDAIEKEIEEIVNTSDAELSNSTTNSERTEENQATNTAVSAETNNTPVTNNTEKAERVKPNSELAYEGLFEDRKKEILGFKEERMKRLRERAKHDITGRRTRRIMGYEIELKALDEMEKNFANREKLDPELEEKISELDAEHDKIVNTTKEYQEQIKHLKEMRNQLVNAREQRRVDREVKRLERKIVSLHIDDISLVNQQKAIMYSKYKKDIKKQSILSQAAGNVAFYEEKQAVNDELLKMVDGESLFDGLKQTIYEIRGDHYRKRIERSKAILSEMQSKDSIIAMRGARFTSLTKKEADRLRENNERQATNQAAMAI